MRSYTTKKSELIKTKGRDLKPLEVITLATFLTQDGAKYDYIDMNMTEATKEVQKNIKYWINEITNSNLNKAFDTGHGVFIVSVKLNIETIEDIDTNEEGTQISKEVYQYLITPHGKVITGDFDIIADNEDIKRAEKVKEFVDHLNLKVDNDAK